MVYNFFVSISMASVMVFLVEYSTLYFGDFGFQSKISDKNHQILLFHDTSQIWSVRRIIFRHRCENLFVWSSIKFKTFFSHRKPHLQFISCLINILRRFIIVMPTGNNLLIRVDFSIGLFVIRYWSVQQAYTYGVHGAAVCVNRWQHRNTIQKIISKGFYQKSKPW